jgi:hypothetical protein
VGDRGGQGAEARDAGDPRELGADLRQRLFGGTLRGHVLDRADVLQRTVPGMDPVRHDVEVFLRAPWHLQAVLAVDLQARPGRLRRIGECTEGLAVEASGQHLDAHRLGLVDFEDAMELP